MEKLGIHKPQISRASVEASFYGSRRDLVGAWYSNELQTRLLLIDLRVDRAFKSIASSHLILLSFQQMMGKMLVAAESLGSVRLTLMTVITKAEMGTGRRMSIGVMWVTIFKEQARYTMSKLSPPQRVKKALHESLRATV